VLLAERVMIGCVGLGWVPMCEVVLWRRWEGNGLEADLRLDEGLDEFSEKKGCAFYFLP
jgi:hypothetical protein